jgi:hypothetical protein
MKDQHGNTSWSLAAVRPAIEDQYALAYTKVQ